MGRADDGSGCHELKVVDYEHRLDKSIKEMGPGDYLIPLGGTGECPGCTQKGKRVTIVRMTLKSVAFTTDHGVMTDYMSDFGGVGGSVYTNPEWIRDDYGRNFPMSHTQGASLGATVTLKVEPAGVTFNLIGEGPEACLSFHQNGLFSTGSDQQVTVTADAPLPPQVQTLSGTVSWKITVSGVDCSGASSGAHKAYVTWGIPTGGGYTERRIEWVCSNAAGATTQVACADNLHTAVAAQTTFGPGQIDGWALLDGPDRTGDCGRQANCMAQAVNILGAGPAEVKYVRASTDPGAGNCLNLESRLVNERIQYLVLYFTGAIFPWNAYEGTCASGNSYYAITPTLKQPNDYQLLKALDCKQYWITTKGDLPPGTTGWEVDFPVEEVPLP